ncbi:MAG: Glu/Leu/Phe/Val family dehydrogenase, partial [Vulcanimicrobiaceae bacterium]
FGNVGSLTARFLAEAGCKIIGISDVGGAYINERGIDIPSAIAYAQEHHSLDGYRGGDRVDNAGMLEAACDVLIPAALENVLTMENAKRVQAKLIVEGANGPTTPEADAILRQRGIDVIPDIVANAGGVIVSYFEWVQDRQGFFWREADVNNRLREQLLDNFKLVRDIAALRNVSYRTAAYMLAIQRVVTTLNMRGMYA